MKLQLKHLLNINAHGQPELLAALARVRHLPLPIHRAFEVIKLIRALEPLAKDVIIARNLAIEKHGTKVNDVPTIEPGTQAMVLLLEELKPLGEREEALPLKQKIRLPANVCISPSDLEILEPLFELENES